ncbi:MAG TPA: exonuclease domain-containing protein [Flavobacterium sp.]|jgi:DNA polymerase-3 subunit epsilon
MYAILDIETTGGQFNEEGITEIAIYKFDGHEIVDQFISLVNPEIPIQPFVVKLTGINNAMLRSAPKFFEVAKRIIEITQDCVLVAHNAVFDYRILRTEFRRLGYNFEAHTLCTVELAQKLLPEQPSHSLGKLVRALGIPMADRHRASGDAMATVKLFKLLLAKDVEKIIVRELIKTEVEKGIAPRLLDIVESLPSRTGIYYIHKEDGTIIFIGKSQNIKKRVNQHFTGTSPKCKKIQAEVFAVTFEETGSELISILKELEEIKVNHPIYSKPQSRSGFPYSVYSEKDADGYLNLQLQKSDRKKDSIVAFSSLSEGKNTLFRLTDQYHLCQKLTGLYETESNCFLYTINQCDGACIGKVAPDEYNARVTELIADLSLANRNMMLIDRGRTISERSAILIENGSFKGYAFYDLNYQITNINILKSILVTMPDNRDTKNIIQTYIRKNKRIKIVSF